MTTFLPKRILSTFKFMRSGGRVMLFRSFAHWLLIIFGVFFLAVSALVVAEMGLLGDAAHAWVIWIIAEFDGLYGPHKGPIDVAVKSIGAVGTALGAAWTVHKGWHYAERNLPARLVALNERWKRELEQALPTRVPALGDVVSIAIEPVAAQSLFMRLVGWIHDPSQWALERGREHISGYKDDLKVLTASWARCQTQLVSAHLEVAAQLSRARKSDEALAEFEKALIVNGADVHALEATARQAFAVGQRDGARKHLQKLAKLSAKSGDVLRRVRAMRFEAEVLKGGPDDEPEQARDTLKSVIEILRDTSIRNEKAKSVELCLAYGQLADVQLVRSVLFAARTALNRARDQFRALEQDARHHLRKWLDDIDARLMVAEADRDKDHDKKEESAEDEPPPSDSPEPTDRAPEGKGKD